VHKSRSEAGIVFRYAIGAIGAALLVYLVVHAGPRALLENAKALGWGLLVVIALGGLSHAVKAWAWRLTLPSEAQYPFLRMFGLRLVSEAMGQLGVPGVVAGEATRVSLLGSEVPLASRILSVTLDRGLFIACGTIVMVCGITLGLVVLSLSNAMRIYSAIFAITFLGVLVALLLAFSKGWPLLSAPASALARIPWIGRWVQSKESLIWSVEQKLLAFHHERPSAFWGSVALNFACHALAIAEVYLILLFMGKNISPAGAWTFESMTKLINVAGSLTPGNVGIYEGGTMVIAGLFGLSSTVGLTLGLCRRARALFWALSGGVFFLVFSRSFGGHKENNGAGSETEREQQRHSETSNQAHCESSAKTNAAILFVNNCDAHGFCPDLAHIGTLPVILRAILQAQSANAKRIIVAATQTDGQIIRRELLRTGRLPKTVEWFAIGGAHRSLPQLVGHVAEDADRILVLHGGIACHPRLYQIVSEWDGNSGAMTLTTGGQFVGIGVLSRETAFDIARHCPEDVETPVELYAWFKPRQSVVFEEVEADLWHAISAPRDRLVAEDKLNYWLVKPTDGLYARMNRRVSIPISRELIKFPITPNMVTLFTLGVSFLAGAFFAFGGYWNTLLGAVLSVWASILDGCDGEVARLKLQASKFGCWLETICDYLYYVVIFAGMAVGLAKTRGSDAYFIWGGCLLFGAVGSFFVVGFARHYFSSRQPEQFLRVWHGKTEQQKRNPLMFMSRHFEFMIRRCCLPYILLAFAILNLTRFFFIGSAVGANLVWIIALYSSYILSKRSSSVPLVAAKEHRQCVGDTVFT